MLAYICACLLTFVRACLYLWMLACICACWWYIMWWTLCSQSLWFGKTHGSQSREEVLQGLHIHGEWCCSVMSVDAAFPVYSFVLPLSFFSTDRGVPHTNEKVRWRFFFALCGKGRLHTTRLFSLETSSWSFLFYCLFGFVSQPYQPPALSQRVSCLTQKTHLRNVFWRVTSTCFGLGTEYAIG